VIKLHLICCCHRCCHSPDHYSSLGPLAPKPTTYKLIGMLGAIISYMSIILLGYTAVGISGPACVFRALRIVAPGIWT
jgi:hypothetical protein